jgi:TonB family protein
MTTSLWLRDIASYALQLAVIVAAGAALWQVLGVRHAAVSYGYWRALLLACLLLPLVQPWHAAPAPAVASSVALVRADDSGERVAGNAAQSAPHRTWPVPLSLRALLLAVLAAGAACRGLWLAIGAFGLRRLRRTAQPLEPPPPGIRAAQDRLAIRALVCVSDRVSSPITFGFTRPIVIVPSGVLAMEPELQEAIVCHELLHVRRRDWLKVLGEEAVRTVFWFHPAIWWLIGRIQLSREHVVDEAVIRVTASRDRYVEAMLAVARAQSSIVPTPASLFLRRRFLKRRVAHLLQEATMTTRRLIASVTFSVATLTLVAAFAARTFPLEAQGPPSPPGASSGPVEIARGGEHLLHGGLPDYPRRAVAQRVEGDVVLDVSIDERGEVSDARVLSGLEELRRAALESVLQWHYAPDKLRSTSAQVALRFRVPDKLPAAEKLDTVVTFERAPKRYTVTYHPEASKEKIASTLRRELQLVELTRALADASLDGDRRAEYQQKQEATKRQLEKMRDLAVDVEEATPLLARIKADRLPASFVQQILDAAGIKVGEPLTKESMKRVGEVVSSLDEHVLVRFERAPGGMLLVLIAP